MFSWLAHSVWQVWECVWHFSFDWHQHVAVWLWFSCDLALLLLASHTNNCSHEPSYSDHNNSSYSSTFSMSDNKPDKSTDGNDVSKMTHSSWVSWFGFIWSDNELKLHRVIRRHTTSCSVLKAQWLSFLQSWLGRFWLQLDSPTELAQTPCNTLVLLLSMKRISTTG